MIQFTGQEAWLKIPVEDLKMSDLPADYWPAIIALALRQMPYREYLQTEHWHQVRERTLAEQRWTCNVCRGRAVDAHHFDYSRKGFEHPNDVKALCRPHHTQWHDNWTPRIDGGTQ